MPRSLLRMNAVSSNAVLCKQLIFMENPIALKCFSELFLIVPSAPKTAGITIALTFDSLCICNLKSSYSVIFSNSLRWYYDPLATLPDGISLLKVHNRNTRTRCEICSKLSKKTPERRQGFVNVEHISCLFLPIDLFSLLYRDVFCADFLLTESNKKYVILPTFFYIACTEAIHPVCQWHVVLSLF